MDQLLDDLFLRLSRHPRACVACAFLIVLLIASQIRAPVIEGSMVDEMSGANPSLEVAARIAAAQGNLVSAAVMVTPRTVSIGEVFDNLESLRTELTAVHESIQLVSITDVQDQLFLYRLSTIDPVVELLTVLRDNEQSTTIISRDGRRFLVLLRAPEALEHQVLDVLARHNWSAISTDQTILAGAQLERDIASGLAKDLRLLIPAIVCLMLFALFLAFGHWLALLLPVFASVASTVIIFALFSIADVTINIVTLLALPIVLIVGLANSCHFLAKSKSVVGAPDDIDAAVGASLRRVGPPFLLSSLTTSIALASLGLNKLAPIAHLGLLSAAALAILFVLVSLAAPMLLRFYLQGSGASIRESGMYCAASRRIAKSRRQIGAVVLLLALAGGAVIPALSVNSDPRIFFPDNAPFAAALHMFEDDFYVFSPLGILVTAQDSEHRGMEALRAASDLRVALVGHDGVRRVSVQPATNDDGAFVLTALLASVGQLRSVRDFIDELRPSLGSSVEVVYSSATMLYEDIDKQAMQSLLQSLSWSVALIFGAIVVVFRSFRALLSALLANIAPLMLVCGAMWLVGDPLNLVTLFVFLVALGVIVDDTVHILFWHSAGDRLSGSSIEFSVMLSTAMLCLGLLLCLLSDFPTTRQFAGYCALALVAAVVSDLSVLPLALRWRAAGAH